ncbi:MAG: hypothetical protein Q8Q12_16700 [bacterium]|nr:hypothetical protein [bacterium]
MASVGNVLQVAWRVVVGIGIFAGSIFAFVRLCAVVRSVAKGRLNRFEREMLAEAVQHNGLFCEMPGLGSSSWIEIGDKGYRSGDDPSLAATYLEAFQKLIIHGCVRYEKGLLYVLTQKGWTLGRKYAKKRREKQNAGKR